MSVSCDERADVWNEKAVRARKAHKCDACELTIRPGDVYTRDKLLYDGEWDTVVRCARCQLIFEHLQPMCSRDGDCPDRELDCGHEYSERWDREPPEWLAALAFWVPGDPLPATNECISLKSMQYYTPKYLQALVCTDQIYVREWYQPGTTPRAGHCTSAERVYTSRSNYGRETPVKGDPTHTLPCSVTPAEIDAEMGAGR